MKSLFWYSHRFGGNLAQLDRAAERVERLAEKWQTEHPERVLWAPWISLAIAEMPESEALEMCIFGVRHSHGIVLDMDGAGLSPGMREERYEARTQAKHVVSVDGEDMHEIEEGKKL